MREKESLNRNSDAAFETIFRITELVSVFEEASPKMLKTVCSVEKVLINFYRIRQQRFFG